MFSPNFPRSKSSLSFTPTGMQISFILNILCRYKGNKLLFLPWGFGSKASNITGDLSIHLQDKLAWKELPISSPWLPCGSIIAFNEVAWAISIV